MLAILTLNETEYIYRICQIFVARFRIWGGLSNALGRLSLPKPPRGAGAGLDTCRHCQPVSNVPCCRYICSAGRSRRSRSGFSPCRSGHVRGKGVCLRQSYTYWCSLPDNLKKDKVSLAYSVYFQTSSKYRLLIIVAHPGPARVRFLIETRYNLLLLLLLLLARNAMLERYMLSSWDCPTFAGFWQTDGRTDTVPKQLYTGSPKQRHTIVQGLEFFAATTAAVTSRP